MMALSEKDPARDVLKYTARDQRGGREDTSKAVWELVVGRPGQLGACPTTARPTTWDAFWDASLIWEPVAGSRAGP